MKLRASLLWSTFLVIVIVVLSVMLVKQFGKVNESPVINPATVDISKLPDIRATIVTDRGDIDIVLFPSKAPVTVANFCNLAKRGFYNGLTFFRVDPEFAVQAGDPEGNGSGGPGYGFEDEFAPSLVFDDQAGMLGMANEGAGTKTNGSQFFITENPVSGLDRKYPIFGKVIDRLDVVLVLQAGDRIRRIDILDPTDKLFAVEQKRINEWNAILDQQERLKPH